MTLLLQCHLLSNKLSQVFIFLTIIERLGWYSHKTNHEILTMIEQAASNKSSLLLTIILQNT